MFPRLPAAARLAAIATAFALLMAACSLDNDPAVETTAAVAPGPDQQTTTSPQPTSVTLPALPELPPETVPGAMPRCQAAESP